jgi:hypothetical protein
VCADASKRRQGCACVGALTKKSLGAPPMKLITVDPPSHHLACSGFSSGATELGAGAAHLCARSAKVNMLAALALALIARGVVCLCFATGVYFSEGLGVRQEAALQRRLRGCPLSQEGRLRRPSNKGSARRADPLTLSLDPKSGGEHSVRIRI